MESKGTNADMAISLDIDTNSETLIEKINFFITKIDHNVKDREYNKFSNELEKCIRKYSKYINSELVKQLKKFSKKNITAKFILGCIYHFGYGVVQDYRKACFIYELSADKGNSLSQNNLGIMYQSGLGKIQDHKKMKKIKKKHIKISIRRET